MPSKIVLRHMVMEYKVFKCAGAIFKVNFEVQPVFNLKLFKAVLIFATRGGGGCLANPRLWC